MGQKFIKRLIAALAVVFAVLLSSSGEAQAHCDTMDGPVVKAAQRALATRNVNLILIWVRQNDDAEIRRRFVQTLAVRRLNREARELADNYFFETGSSFAPRWRRRTLHRPQTCRHGSWPRHSVGRQGNREWLGGGVAQAV